MQRRLSGRAGFTLILVIWALGLCSLMITGFLSMARDRLQAGANTSAFVRAEALAEAAINLTLLNILAAQEQMGGQEAKSSSVVTFCSLPGGYAAIVVEDERGKVDLNAAGPELLSRLLVGFGVESARAQMLAGAIVAFRSAPTNGVTIEDRLYRDSGHPFPPRKGLFQSSLELDQVLGMDGELFTRLRPFITVHSFSSDVNASLASPLLLRALGEREGTFPPSGSSASGHAFLIHAEAASDGGGYFVREAIVTRGSRDGAYGEADWSVKEWRRSDVRFREALSTAGAQPRINC